MQKITLEQQKAIKNDFILFTSKMLEKPFVVDAENRQQINAIFSVLVFGWIDSTSESILAKKMALSKGFLIMGNFGTGKSILMRAISEFKRAIKQPTFRFVTASEACQHYKLTGSIDLYTYNDEGIQGKPVTCCFDELGREPEKVDNYGTKMDVMSQILQDRYTLWQSKGLITHYITNMSIAEIKQRYGEFIVERLLEQCNLVVFDGKSRRKN